MVEPYSWVQGHKINHLPDYYLYMYALLWWFSNFVAPINFLLSVMGQKTAMGLNRIPAA